MSWTRTLCAIPAAPLHTPRWMGNHPRMNLFKKFLAAVALVGAVAGPASVYYDMGQKRTCYDMMTVTYDGPNSVYHDM